MVDIKYAFNKTLVRDNQTNKTHTILDDQGAALDVDKVLWVDVVEREDKPIHTGQGNSVNRLYEITMAYLPDTGSGTPVTAQIRKLTTDESLTATQRAVFNNFRVNNVGMNALPTIYIDNNVTYNCFFWSHGADDGTLFIVFSQRIKVRLGEEDSGLTVLDGKTTFGYSKSVRIHVADLTDTHDLFVVVT